MLRGVLLGLLWGIESSAAPKKLDLLKVGSLTYTNITIVGTTATDLYFTYDKGAKNVKLRHLDPETQKLFDYDPKNSSEAEKQQTEEDARFQETLAAGIANRGASSPRPTDAVADARASKSSEDNLADPISDRSLLGKPGPPLDIEKWLGPAPDLKGKFVLVSFWAPWSNPCRRYLARFNSFQTKFAEKLQIVGLIPEADAENPVPEGKSEFPSAVDVRGKLQGAVGVKSVPYVLLMNPQGIVLYQGHPAALGEKDLDTILSKNASPK